MGKIKPDKGQKITFKANQNNKDSLKSLLGKKVSYTLQNGFASNIEEVIEPTHSNQFPSLTSQKTKKRAGPSNTTSRFSSWKPKKSQGHRKPGTLMAAGVGKIKKTRKRRL